VKNGKFPLHFSTPVKIIRDFAEWFEGGFAVFDDFLHEDIACRGC
jgi:hypothetical protein